MTCPVCGGNTRVVDTRHPDCETVWRRRECTECGYRFNTEEQEIRRSYDSGKKINGGLYEIFV